MNCEQCRHFNTCSENLGDCEEFDSRPLTSDEAYQIGLLLKDGKEIQAIKAHRDCTGAFLKHSKEFVEAAQEAARAFVPDKMVIWTMSGETLLMDGDRELEEVIVLHSPLTKISGCLADLFLVLPDEIQKSAMAEIAERVESESTDIAARVCSDALMNFIQSKA